MATSAFGEGWFREVAPKLVAFSPPQALTSCLNPGNGGVGSANEAVCPDARSGIRSAAAQCKGDGSSELLQFTRFFQILL